MIDQARVRIKRYLHGWYIFCDLYLQQRRKKHGSGKRNRIGAIYIALCGRYIVDGQWRGRPGPNINFWWKLANVFSDRRSS